MSYSTSATGSEDGFTLIEILLAVYLIAMMAALVFGSLDMTTKRSNPHERSQPMNRSFARTLRLMTMSWQSARVRQSPWVGINDQRDGQTADSVAFYSRCYSFRGDPAKDMTGPYRLHQRG